MKDVIEMASGGMIYIPNFTMISSGIKVYYPNNLESLVLVLLIRWIY
jgi:hypothetical protein